MTSQPVHIQKGTLVQFEYRLTADSGELLDSSSAQGPLEYQHGCSHIIAGLEEALEGALEGQELQARVPPEKAYGLVHEELIQRVPLSVFEGVDGLEDIKEGMQFEATLQNGQTRKVTVKDITPENLLVDGNHPFAGKWLNFDIKVLSVQLADKR